MYSSNLLANTNNINYTSLGQNILNFQADKALGNVLPLVGQWVFYLAIALNVFAFLMAAFYYFIGDSTMNAKDNLKKGNEVLTIAVIGLILLLFVRIGFYAIASIFDYSIVEPLRSISK